MKLVSKNERIAQEDGVRGLVTGLSDAGKTHLIWTMNPEDTLFIDAEAGDCAVRDWPGDFLRVDSWMDCKNIACLLAGADPKAKHNTDYSDPHWYEVHKAYGEMIDLSKYKNYYFDSLTHINRMCLQYAKNHEDNYTSSGKLDMRAAYGMLGQEMLAWINQLNRVRDKNVWYIALVNEERDDKYQVYYPLQFEGGTFANALYGKMDVVLFLDKYFDESSGKTIRRFITDSPNGIKNCFAKNRGNYLDTVEEAHLGKALYKIKTSQYNHYNEGE